MPNTSGTSLDQRTFKTLRQLYLVALSAIAISVVLSQLLIHRYLDDQKSDSTVVNIAGRQRMLSQKLSKELLQLLVVEESSRPNKLSDTLKKTLKQWTASHNALLKGSDSLGLPGSNSAEVQSLFRELGPAYQRMRVATAAIIDKLEQSSQTPTNELKVEIDAVLANEATFLEGMDTIVNQYELEANKKVLRLGQLEYVILGLTLLILLCELLFIFWPAAKKVKQTIGKLIKAESDAKKMAHDADLLSESKEKSVHELRALNEAMNQTLLFARVSSDGEIIQLGKEFASLFKIRKFGAATKIQDLLSIKTEERKHIEMLLESNARKGWQGELNLTTAEEETIWLEMSMIPFMPMQDKREILVIAIDITRRKEAQLEIERLRQDNFEEKMNQQKLISSKIIENQENEQNRIAKDIHDGIGQMLTGLSFNIESIDLNNLEKANQKIEGLKDLVAKIIKGVRTATFNLMPPELSDHGIVPALNKLTQELAKLTGKNILLYDKTGFNERLFSLVEINIYRITQEAINNAIKYADSTDIVVSLSHSDSILSITIDDNGKGFDTTKVKAPNGDGGMGLTFMRERIKYIDGRLFINSTPGKGTRVTINVPLDS